MMGDYLLKLSAGLPVSLGLTLSAVLIALLIAVTLTILLALRHRVTNAVIHGYLTLFTGTPLLVQIFLIYYGPGQFPNLQHYPRYGRYSLNLGFVR